MYVYIPTGPAGTADRYGTPKEHRSLRTHIKCNPHLNMCFLSLLKSTCCPSSSSSCLPSSLSTRTGRCEGHFCPPPRATETERCVCVRLCIHTLFAYGHTIQTITLLCIIIRTHRHRVSHAHSCWRWSHFLYPCIRLCISRGGGGGVVRARNGRVPQGSGTGKRLTVCSYCSTERV